MSLLVDFDYFKPASLKESLELKEKYKGASSILAGGTDLIVRIKDGFEAPEAVIDLKAIDELKALDFKDNRLLIGASCTFAELEHSKLIQEKFPVIYEAAKSVASCSIRHRATMAGNLCSAVPSLDSGPALLVYDADIVLASVKGERKVKITEFFQGVRKTAMRGDEILVRIEVLYPQTASGGAYVKLGRYDGEDLAQVGVGILAVGEDIKVALGAVSPVAFRAKKTEEFLKGKTIDKNIIEEAKNILISEASPISDIRASKEYRTHMIGVMFERGLLASLSRKDKKGPAYGIRLI